MGIPEIRYAATPDGINIAVSGSGVSFEDVSEPELKGVPGTWRLYRVETV